MNRIKELRLGLKLTQTAVQMKTGIDQTLLSKYETGERVPTVDNLMLLAAFYGTSMDYIMGLTDETRPYPRQHNPN
ncbi:helix-turn-helix transcriptional regulator [Oscillospiraceae bacterium MB08-C2-2]|nr:helix-turn-helix transcriptional regulator [Oscillospiraceae bacterium MB08-C2-2]